MVVLLDANLLVYLVMAEGPLFALTFAAIRQLQAGGAILRTTPQVLIEFRSTATRPLSPGIGSRPGLGMWPADAKMAEIEGLFPVLNDRATIFRRWKSLVARAAVSGRQVHDARLVAVCEAHGVSHLATFNGADFRRFLPMVPGLILLDPREMAEAKAREA